MIDAPNPLPPLRNAKALGDWLNRLRDYTMSLAPMISEGVHTSRMAIGTFRRVIPITSEGITQFRIKDWEASDWLICRTWDGKTEGTNDVYVAKAYYLRADVFDGASIDIVVESLDDMDSLQVETRTLSYLYYSSTFRTVTDVGDSSTENQIVIPRFLEDDTILAVPSTDLTVVREGQALHWVDLNCDARAWMKSQA